MEKVIKLPYTEFKEMEDTISRLNKSLRTAINHEGNMVIDNREVDIRFERKQVRIPKISGPTNELFEFYRKSFDDAYENIDKIQHRIFDKELEVDRAKRRYDQLFEKREARKAWDFWIACIVVFFVGLAIGLYS